MGAFYGTFRDKRDLVDLHKVAPVSGREEYGVLARLGYSTPHVQNGKVWWVEVGTETDGASTPPGSGFDPLDNRWLRAAIVHDLLCNIARGIVKIPGVSITLLEADSVFYYAARDGGTDYFTAMLMWIYVRARHLVTG